MIPMAFNAGYTVIVIYNDKYVDGKGIILSPLSG